MTTSLSTYAEAVPINAITAHGFGPIRNSGKRPKQSLDNLRRSPQGAWNAIDSMGAIGRRVLTLLAALGGSATAEQFAFQTAPADSAQLAESMARLEIAGLIERSSKGTVSITEPVRAGKPATAISMADQNAINSDVLSIICKANHVKVPSRKQERIDAIAGSLSDPASAERIRNDLSKAAVELMERIATAAGPGFAAPEQVGVPRHEASSAMPSRYSYGRLASNASIAGKALAELAVHGIVGVTEWDTELWIWSEAWPFVDRPFYASWLSVSRPSTAASGESARRLPLFVAAFDRTIAHWESEPPPVLKNGDMRVGKTQIRSTAKLLRLDESLIDLTGRLAIGMELLLTNVVAASGRGRKRTVDRAWMADADLLDAWRELSPSARWARLVAEWCSPGLDVKDHELVNRHLVLWELSRLDPGHGYRGDEAFCGWLHFQNAPMGHSDLACQCLADLRALGVVEAAGPAALTSVGRSVLDDPASLDDLTSTDTTAAYVQADLTVVAPPDLHHDLATRVATIADIEGDSGAVVSRLSLDRITRAVQSGETAESLVDFLTELSSVPLPDTVVRLVHDAAARAGRVRVISAPTVVVVTDPVDLATAVSVKAAKLTEVSPTVAVSELPYARVRAALDRKGLAPELVVGSTIDTTQPRRSSSDVARTAELEAQRYREMAKRSSNTHLERHADSLAARAKLVADVDARLAVSGPLAVTQQLVDRLDTGKSEKRTTGKSGTRNTGKSGKKA